MRSAGYASSAVLASLLAAALPAHAGGGGTAPADPESPLLDVLLVVDISGSVDGLAPESVGGFLGALPPGTRLAVVAFGDDASIVRPLAALSGPADLDAAKQRISGLAFRGRHTELGEGLLLALLEGAADEGSASTRRVVLLSDGRLDPKAGRAAIPEALQSLRNEILPAFAAAGLPVFTAARGEPDLALLREVSERTGGRCALAPDGPALEDALALLAESFAFDSQLVPPAASPPAAPAAVASSVPARKARAPRDAGRSVDEVAAVAPVLVAAIAAILLAVAVAVHRRRSATKGEPISNATETELCAQRLDLEDQLVTAWEAERAARDGQHRLAEELFLVLDHLDRTDAGASGDDRLRWFRDKLDRVLAGAGIGEIRVEIGDAFDSGVHRHVGERDAELPRGAVLAVTRKGYVRRGEDGRGEARVLRPAEVVLSSGRTAQVN